MDRYSVILSSDLAGFYQSVSDNLDMSVEQVLSGALQLYAERLSLLSFEAVTNTKQLEKGMDLLMQKRAAHI